MKTNFLKNILFLFFLIGLISCKAQQEYSIKTDYPYNIPENSYLKDFNNELDPYIGTWKATYNGNETTLYITKEIKKYMSDIKMYSDILFIRYTVKNSQGQILQSTSHKIFEPNQYTFKIQSVSLDNNNVWLMYDGGNCGVGWGRIILTKLSATQFQWEYTSELSVLTKDRCPENQDLKIYLPQTENLVFTKQ